ncbi:unnamed protein product [Schistosoma rodhaini]|nr:unnamed protein product [Schistosoma rodhaini]
MVSEIPRRSIFHRIADSITGFVPSSILPTIDVSIGFPNTTIQVPPAKSDDPLKGVLRTNLKRTNDVLDHCSESGLKNKAWGHTDHTLRYANVDLDAADKSESECSLHSFSTSGVSSLMPKSWVLGCKNGQSRSTALRKELCSDSYMNTYKVCDSVEVTCCKPSPSWQTSRNDFKTCPYPLPKRQRLSTTTNLSPSFTCRSRLGTIYGGAASCRNARELFEFTTPLKFDLYSDRNFQLGSNPTANLSSTARRILETLENLSAPLTSGFLQSTVHKHVKQVKTREKSHRFPPFSKGYEKVDSFRKNCNLHSFCENGAQNHLRSHVSSKPAVFLERVQKQGHVTVECPKVTVKPISDMCKPEDNLLPVYTFADPIHKFSVHDHKTAVSPTAHHEYLFSCPSRLCSKCSTGLIGSEFSLRQITTESNSIKSKITETNTWRCETCLLENSDKRVACQGCSLPKSKPQHAEELYFVSSAPTSVHTVETSVSSLSAINKEASQWECPTCMVFNEQNATKCICCQTLRPTNISTSVWYCPTCLVENNKSDKCCCCSTVKPNGKPYSHTITNNSSLSKLASQPLGHFQFGFGVRGPNNSEKLEAFASNNVHDSEQDDKVHPNKETESSDTFSKSPQKKQSESLACGDFILQTNHMPQLKWPSQLDSTNSNIDFKGIEPSTTTSVRSSLEQTQLLNSTGFKFTFTTTNNLVSVNPTNSSVQKNDALLSTSNPSNSAAVNVYTCFAPSAFPNHQQTPVFNVDPDFGMNGGAISFTNSPQPSNFVDSNKGCR